MPSYGCRFPAMIADWRAKWVEGSLGTTAHDFPFGFVNLAPWINPNNAPAGIRWAQTAGYGHVPSLSLPLTPDDVLCSGRSFYIIYYTCANKQRWVVDRHVLISRAG